MKDEYGRINNKAQVIRELKGAELAYLLGDIAKNPHKYPKNTHDWLVWLSSESGESIEKL